MGGTWEGHGRDMGRTWEGHEKDVGGVRAHRIPHI